MWVGRRFSRCREQNPINVLQVWKGTLNVKMDWSSGARADMFKAQKACPMSAGCTVTRAANWTHIV